MQQAERIINKLGQGESTTQPSNLFDQPNQIDLTNYDKKTFEKLVKRGEIEKIDDTIKKNYKYEIIVRFLDEIYIYIFVVVKIIHLTL